MKFPSAVRENPVFLNLSNSQIESLEAMAVDRVYEGGDVLVRQFDRQSDLMVILHGHVCIKTFSGETISELGPGGVFGEVSLVDEAPRSATVSAKGSVTVAVIPSEKLRKLLDGDLGLKALVMQNISRVLCARLRASNVHLDAAVHKI